MPRIVVLSQATTHPSYAAIDHLSRTTWGSDSHPDVRTIHYYGAYDAGNLPIPRFPAVPDPRSCVLLPGGTLVCGVNDHLGDYVDPRGERFVLALQFCLENFEFDFLYRTTVTSYVDIYRMHRHFDSSPTRERLYDGEPNMDRHGHRFATGFHVMMSRDVVAGVVAHRREYLSIARPEDVATGILITEMLHCAHAFWETPRAPTHALAYVDDFESARYANSPVFNYRFRRDATQGYAAHHRFVTASRAAEAAPGVAARRATLAPARTAATLSRRAALPTARDLPSLHMATIRSVEPGFYRIPLPVTLSDSMHGDMTHFELMTCRIRDADGAEGVGYTFTPGTGGAGVYALLRDELAAFLVGRDAARIEALWNAMWWRIHYAGRGGAASLAISAVDIALWDLAARRVGEPLWRLLGGYDPNVPCYAGGIDLQFPIDALLRQADDFRSRGFRAIKMKVGRERLREDVERVKAMREHLGADFPLMADANMRWTVDQSIRAARALEPFNLVWLEEPTIPDDVAGHARIVREGGVPIAAGENLHSLYEFKQYVAAGAVTYPEPDASNCGGVTVFMKVARLAEAFNLPVTSHGVHDITVHLLAAAPNRSYLEAHGFGLERYLARPLEIVEGCALAPDRAGHGVDFDWQALARLAAGTGS